MFERICAAPAETEALAAAIAKVLRAGTVILLNGELGAGKTFFAAALARALDAPETASSPTFSLMNIYRGRVPIYHFDLYRLNEIAELDGFGFFEYIEDETAICLVEWAEKFPAALPDDYIEINIERLTAGTAAENTLADTASRRFSFCAVGEKAKKRLEEWESVC